jgi:hypothetical protein
VSAWKWMGRDKAAELIREPLEFESVELKTRSYK